MKLFGLLTWTTYTSSLPLYQISNFFTSPLTFSVIPTAVICQETYTVYTDTHTALRRAARHTSDLHHVTHLSCQNTTLSHTSAAWLLPPHILNNKSRAASVGGTPAAITSKTTRSTKEVLQEYSSFCGQLDNLDVLKCNNADTDNNKVSLVNHSPHHLVLKPVRLDNVVDNDSGIEWLYVTYFCQCNKLLY